MDSCLDYTYHYNNNKLTNFTKMRKEILYICCGLLLSCCGYNKVNTIDNNHCIDTLFFSTNFEEINNSIVTDITYIKLNDSHKHIISEVTKATANTNNVFIFDKHHHKINVFDLSGNFIYEINNIGHAHNEYNDIANFTIDDKYIYIIDNTRHQIKTYSVVDGSWVHNYHIDFIAWDIESFGNNQFLFTCIQNNPKGKLSINQPNAAVWTTDSTFQTIKNYYFKIPKDYYEIVGKNYYFTRSKESVIFHTYKNNGFYIFNPDSIIPMYIDVQFSDNSNIRTYKKYEDMQKNKIHYLAETPYLINDHIICEIGEGEFSEVYLIDRGNNKRIYKNVEEGEQNGLLRPCCSINGRIASYIADLDFYNLLIESGFKRADSSTEELLKNGGSCLIVYTIR